MSPGLHYTIQRSESVWTIVLMNVHWPLLINSFSVPLCVPFPVNEPSKRSSIIIEDAGGRGDYGGVMAKYGGRSISESSVSKDSNLLKVSLLLHQRSE